MPVSVTLDSYNPANGNLYFTITGQPLPISVTVQKSINGGVTWINSTGGANSPRTGFTVSVPTLFRLRLENGGELSNILSSDGQMIRTPIVSESQITFVNSPVHLRIQNAQADNTIRSVVVKLWVWTGAQNATLGDPNNTLKKSIVSLDDNYINLEISDIIKAYLERPTNTTYNNQPGFGYNADILPAVSGLGVFWQIQAEITSTGGVETRNYQTNFATLGWLWNYEQNGNVNPILKHGSLGFPMSVKRWYNSNVPNYFTQDFVLGQSVNVATTQNMVSLNADVPTRTRCTRDAALIVYLDKRGLWDVFTPHGKIKIEGDIKSQFSKRVFRDPSKVNNSIAHSETRDTLNVSQTYTVNTGTIDESDVQRVEEIIYSPKIYFIRFMGDVVTEITDGITIDSTMVTIDSTQITIDNTPSIPTTAPYFSTFQQIPVTVEDSDFLRKTLINDKSQIDYNIKFKETTNKINDIR